MYKFYSFLMLRNEIVHLELIAREYIININSKFIMHCFGMSALLKVQNLNCNTVLNTANYTVKLVAGSPWEIY